MAAAMRAATCTRASAQPEAPPAPCPRGLRGGGPALTDPRMTMTRQSTAMLKSTKQA